MQAIISSPEKLWIAARFMSTEKTRYYLNGVYVEPCEEGGITLTATDNYRLVTLHDPDGVTDEPAILKVSKDTLKSLRKATSVTVEDNVLTVHQGKTLSHSHPGDCRIDGSYPDWRRIIETPSGESAPGFNACYLGQFKALYGFEKTDCPAITIYPNGTGPAIVSTCHTDRFAILMPCYRNAGATADIPAWTGKKSCQTDAA